MQWNSRTTIARSVQPLQQLKTLLAVYMTNFAPAGGVVRATYGPSCRCCRTRSLVVGVVRVGEVAVLLRQLRMTMDECSFARLTVRRKLIEQAEAEGVVCPSAQDTHI
jgi:hypothetical protein